jgi:hypothetical protein
MRKLRQSFALTLAITLTTLACGGDDDIAIYRASLFQINPQQEFSVASGNAEIVLHEEDNRVEITLLGLGLDGVSHPAFIWSDRGCPSRAADANDDGVVDIAEGRIAYGNILLPLDGDITTQQMEPVGFPFGTAPIYGSSAVMIDVLNAIGGPDTNVNDFFVPLDLGEDLGLDRRTIVVHGVAPQTLVARPLAAGMQGLNLPSTLPILCGTLQLIS